MDATTRGTAELYAAGFEARALLRDQTPVCMRAIRGDDKERLRVAFGHLSTRSVYQRFFHLITDLTPDYLRELTELDFRGHVALVLSTGEESRERLIAVARFVRVSPGADRAEIAFAVADEYQNRGAATLLLHELVAVAKSLGIRKFVGQMLDNNLDMLRVLQNSKLPLRQRVDGNIRNVELSIDAAS